MSSRDGDERERLIHELEVHQAELESQNRELREAQQLLEESRARFADLYDFAPIAYLTFDQAGLIREINLAGAQILGAERARLIGRPFIACVPIRDSQTFLRHVRECFDSRAPRKVELTLSPSGRSSLIVEMISAPAVDATGKVVACRSALTDITARKQAEEALRLAVRMREDFLAVVSHDLRNPLSSIMLGTDALLRSNPATDARRDRKQLESIRRATERMNRLVTDLLDLSSMDAGHLSMNRAVNDVRNMVSTAVEIVQPLAMEKRIRLEADLPNEPLLSNCDRERIIQVLLNLIGNAVKFTDAGGTILAAARAIGEGVICSVRDSGAGISEEIRGHVFDPYWQSEKHKTKGAGLGLSIAKGIVEFHGGRIWVDSEVARGSTFFFTLPSVATAERGQHELSLAPIAYAQRPQRSARNARKPNRRLLIVDDEIDTRNSLQEILTTESYQVTVASNGEEALARLRASAELPALILLDLIMPVMDGWGFLSECRRDPRLAGIPVVLISGQVDARETASRFHLAGLIEKPIGIANLFRTLHDVAV